MKPQITPVALLVTLLSGCAGYNHTLFMTKSNAGLDFDAKPPTAEITISRKEVVIAPTFEGGLTPPVMASFKPEAGIGGGFGSFFLGVDQTFAGGDAAVVMGKLYDSTSTPSDTIAYSSSLKLSTAPKYKDVFRRAAKPGTVHPLIFGTDTILGLKVAWSGIGGQFPDSVKAGFNRKEFAWAPLTMTNEIVGNATNYVVRMPSFLATVDSDIKVGTDPRVKAGSIQYFATGEAATQLATKPAVRQAMIYRLDPAGPAKAAAQKRVTENLSKTDRIIAHVTVNGKVERARLKALVEDTGLAGNEKWLNRFADKDPEPLREALSRDYYQYIASMAKNLP